MGAGAALIGAGTAIGIIGQQQANREQRRTLKRNERALRQQAELVEIEARKEAQRFRRESDVQLGNLASSFARGGIEIGTGTAGIVQASERLKFREDEAAIIRQARLNAQNFLQQSSNLRRERQSLRRAGNINLVGSILGGAGAIIGASRSQASGKLGSNDVAFNDGRPLSFTSRGPFRNPNIVGFDNA